MSIKRNNSQEFLDPRFPNMNGTLFKQARFFYFVPGALWSKCLSWCTRQSLWTLHFLLLLLRLNPPLPGRDVLRAGLQKSQEKISLGPSLFDFVQFLF